MNIFYSTPDDYTKAVLNEKDISTFSVKNDYFFPYGSNFG